MDRIPELLSEALRVFAAMSPWLVGGFFAAGVLAVWIPRAWVNRALGGRTGLSGVVRAVLIGVPLPICSCGVLPIAAGLRRNGAGKGATAAFLISTPQTGVDSILATYALMGPVFAVARPLAAALTGLVGGAVVSAVGGDDAAAAPADEPPPPSRGLREILRQAYVRLLGSIAKPLAAGLAVSALVTVLVPDNFFAEAFGGRDWLAMPAMALVGLPMYVCSTASIPIAASLMLKGVSPGAAFVFLMVGPAMNAVSVTTVASLIGRKATAAYVATILAGAILCGCAVNAFVDPEAAVQAACCAGHGLTPLHWACAAFLAAMTAYNLARPAAMPSGGRAGEPGGCCGGGDGCCGGAAPAPAPAPAKEIGRAVATCELALDGLRCMNCVAHAKKALEAIPGVAADVTLDPPRAVVRMDRDVPEAALRAAIEGEGYRVVSIG